jgi:hypothetical protein
MQKQLLYNYCINYVHLWTHYREDCGGRKNYVERKNAIKKTKNVKFVIKFDTFGQK